MNAEYYTNKISKRIPSLCVKPLAFVLFEHQCVLKITQTRATKLGDFRVFPESNQTQITVNNDLNQYAFLVTLVHEIAHLITWIKHSRKVKPHGNEWKTCFKNLLFSLPLEESVPDDVLEALILHCDRVKASSSADNNLVRVLRNYDNNKTGIELSEVNDDDFFVFRSRVYQKKVKVRTRYRCLRLDNDSIYLISGSVIVTCRKIEAGLPTSGF